MTQTRILIFILLVLVQLWLQRFFDDEHFRITVVPNVLTVRARKIVSLKKFDSISQ